MPVQDEALNFSDCLTVSEAAEFLGVSTATLRNWDRSGKLKPRRHPQNGYRIYLHEDLEQVLRSAKLCTPTDEIYAPIVDWSKMRDSEHIVQFYENDEFLIQCISEYVGTALSRGDASVVIATHPHRVALQQTLMSQGINVSAAIESGRYMVLDAAETLAKIMVNGSPDENRFLKVAGAMIAQLSEGGRRVFGFGEMVALLWEDGNRHGAIRLEELWNEAAKKHRLAIFCAYPINLFGGDGAALPFHGICASHSRVIPSESYADIGNVDERLRAISMLQQKAQSLIAEMTHRLELEKILAARDSEIAELKRVINDLLEGRGVQGTGPSCLQSESSHWT
jgi:hypothetical protein